MKKFGELAFEWCFGLIIMVPVLAMLLWTLISYALDSIGYYLIPHWYSSEPEIEQISDEELRKIVNKKPIQIVDLEMTEEEQRIANIRKTVLKAMPDETDINRLEEAAQLLNRII